MLADSLRTNGVYQALTSYTSTTSCAVWWHPLQSANPRPKSNHQQWYGYIIHRYTVHQIRCTRENKHTRCHNAVYSMVPSRGCYRRHVKGGHRSKRSTRRWNAQFCSSPYSGTRPPDLEIIVCDMSVQLLVQCAMSQEYPNSNPTLFC